MVCQSAPTSTNPNNTVAICLPDQSYPMPEVADGLDNDCDGINDNIPGHNVDTNAFANITINLKVLVLIPPEVISGGKAEANNTESILDAWGVPYHLISDKTLFIRYLATPSLLAQYPMIIFPGYTEGTYFPPQAVANLEAFANSGGVLLMFKPFMDYGTGNLQLCGLKSIARASVTHLKFNAQKAPMISTLDAPQELEIMLDDFSDPSFTVYSYILSVDSSASVGAQVLANGYVRPPALVDTMNSQQDRLLGPMVVMRPMRNGGAVYSFGHDFVHFAGYRSYVNSYEPSFDVIGIMYRNAFRQATMGHVVLKHTVPGFQDALMFMTHDVDAPDATQPGPWGLPGALQIAQAAIQYGARCSFMVTTDYIAGYYNVTLIKEFCSMGLCPVGDHSVTHQDMSVEPVGSFQMKMFTSYAQATVAEEIEISQYLLSQAEGNGTSPVGYRYSKPLVFRAPYLALNPALFDLLAAKEFIADLSLANGDIKTNLPINDAKLNMFQYYFRYNPIYDLTLTNEDGIGTIVNGVKRRTELQSANIKWFLSQWTNSLIRNAHNNAHTVFLIHPSYGIDMTWPNQINKIIAAQSMYQEASFLGNLKMDLTVEEFVAMFWRPRDLTSVDATYKPSLGYQGSITTGAYPVTNFTLQFGDDILQFMCPSCTGPSHVSRNRVLITYLAPNSVYDFFATVNYQESGSNNNNNNNNNNNKSNSNIISTSSNISSSNISSYNKTEHIMNAAASFGRISYSLILGTISVGFFIMFYIHYYHHN